MVSNRSACFENAGLDGFLRIAPAAVTDRGTRHLATGIRPTVSETQYARVELIAVPGLPLVQPGDDLASLLIETMQRASLTAQPGDVFVVETPGGGGYGEK